MGTFAPSIRIKKPLNRDKISEVMSTGAMEKSVYDPDENGKIDYNELENVGKRVYVQSEAPTEANEGDIWFKTWNL